MTNTVPEYIDTIVRKVMEEWEIPGLAITVTRDGEEDWVAAYGARDVETVLPVTGDTQFILCSVTKSFTALGLAMLVDEGRLDWNMPVRDYLPEFRLHDAVATERVTIIDLLSHHTGLPRHDWIWMPADISRAEMLAALRYLEPSKDIRAAWQYCNLGYAAAGMVTERISGQPWEDFTRTRIMNPLGMVNVGFSDADLTSTPDSARPYILHDHERPGEFVRQRARLWPIANTPAGGINVSASDMARYMRLYLADGKVDGATLISEARLEDLYKPRVYTGKSQFSEIGESHYGLGLATHLYRGERIISHSGGWIGWSTLMSLVPGRGLGVTVLMNRGGSPAADIITNAILDHVVGKDAIPWFERFREARRAYVAQRPADVAAQRATRRTDAPSRPLGEYVGDYTHPAYGRVTIEAVAEALALRYRGMSGALIHRHYDAFEFDDQPGTLWPDGLVATFLYDREGRIDRLLVPLEPNVADIVFCRVASGDSLDAAFRQACVGTYRGGAHLLVVAINADGELTLSPTGQPTYRLDPYRESVFAIRELPGYRVAFVRDDGGVVATIVFHQPNGTFQARREIILRDRVSVRVPRRTKPLAR
ncbi:serine hydrolase [Paraburkholderia sp. J76]|uniref:serine hydrolase n=1 Tax=Paraburkholderia sp. J76 TaxID=2805439 RepID=UPI002ABE424E|nr:serine hydrolase [Paraburkholderia sp. J76]